MPYDNHKVRASSGIVIHALTLDGGAEKVEQWVASFPASDREAVVENLVRMRVEGAPPLRPGAAAVLARLVNGTPGLSDDVRQHAKVMRFRSFDEFEAWKRQATRDNRASRGLTIS